MFDTPAHSIPFDHFEVHGAIHQTHTVLVADAEADYWTVIGSIKGQRVCGIGRFGTRAEAEAECRSWRRAPASS